jgi:hypothetical protein
LHEILKLRAPGLLGCALSGAGPSILVFFERGYESVCDLVRQIFRLHGHESETLSPATIQACSGPVILALHPVLCGGLMANSDFDQTQAARFAALALDCVHKPYPNKIAHSLNSDADVKPPRELTPAFYGCYDWHSSVHGHWLLVRLARLFPQAPFAAEARRAVARSLTPANIAQEVVYLNAAGPQYLRAPLRPGLAAATGRRVEGVRRSRRRASGRPRCARWNRPSRRASPSGCRNCNTPSAPASTITRLSPWA